MNVYHEEAAPENSRENLQEREAIRKCLSLLEHMDRTEHMLREKLSEKGFSEEEVSAAIGYARSFGYVDDLRYAENYVRTHCEKQSRRQMDAKLREKGVPSELAYQALELYRDEEAEAAMAFLEKKAGALNQASSREEKSLLRQKLIRQAMQKGFSYSIIRKGMEKLDLTD